jgi:fido (protein-threonine AMPylation protein)
LNFPNGNRRSRRILIQHALERVGLTIDWKWFSDNRELYEEPDGLEDLLELAVHPA